MTKIIKSLAVVAFVAMIAIGGTIAYFSDTETSTENTFTAGELDLKINNECHYNGMVCKCDVGVCVWQAENPGNSDSYVETKDAYIGGPCVCTWAAKDLDGERFYDYEDIKPGDWGEHTISIHVDDNDAYGRILVTAIENRENNCNDPESDVDNTCIGRWCGELAQNMYTFSWIDDGTIPGFGDSNDPEEGDNIWQDREEILTDSGCDGGVTGPNGQIYCPVLPKTLAEDTCTYMTTYGPQDDLPTGWNATQISEVGFIAGGETHYIGTAWFVPKTVNNIIQGDSIQANISFEIVQARHNDPADPFGIGT
jgi:predicted ribosomally synthesized peptide with SipW-like signal peptide